MENANTKLAQLAAPAVLLLATVAGLVLSNTTFAEFYTKTLATGVLFELGSYTFIDKPVLLLVNDGLMAVFFLYIGLELKREIIVGELSDYKKAVLPIFAALGGMAIPALIYFAISPTGPQAAGWGIPMATDIAFALGLLTVLGSRVPASLKVMLTAIAIVDDLGAILVIALFYTSQIDSTALLFAAGLLGLCIAANRAGIKKVSVYMLLGIPLWYFTLKSGIHATIAGVLLAMTIPLSKKGANQAKLISDIFTKKASPLDSPAVFLEKSLTKWVAFVIIPIFAFCNAGISLADAAVGGVSMGIIAGLFIGKPLGIAGGAFLATKLGIATLPKSVNWGQIIGLGFLGGVGFTMSLFIGSLAFTSAALIAQAKMGILIASLAAAIAGLTMLALASRAPVKQQKIYRVKSSENIDWQLLV